MEHTNRYLLQNLYSACKRGAALYRDDCKLSSLSEMELLMEDGRYMMDVEDNDQGDIIRINFVSISPGDGTDSPKGT